jgi:hypothetical protein
MAWVFISEKRDQGSPKVQNDVMLTTEQHVLGYMIRKGSKDDQGYR